MRYILSTTLLAASLAFAAPASAKSSSKFESSISALTSQAVKVEVIVSDDLAYRAENLPKSLRDRSGVRSLNAGFSGNGHYGERELERLAERLEKKMTRRLQKQGIQVDDNASTVLKVTLVDAKNNRPTFEQLSQQVSLSFQSYGTGGAELSGELLSANGTSLGTMSYAWYETDIRDAAYNAGTWRDANRAFDRFARKAAKELAE